ncbi:MAG: hypothetical protein J5842_04930 [Lachnospiraceae bacterium]|nr:hypothetical protein [Lachnospiraceae bacterium]
MIIFTVLFAISCRMLSYKYDDGILQMEQFYRQDRDSIDILVLGSSHAFVDIDPQILYEHTGASTYDLCASMQSIWHTYYDLEEALKYQHPRLIILDVFRITDEFEYSKDSKLIKSVYGMRPSVTKLNAIRAGLKEDDFSSTALHFTEFASYHNRYGSLTGDDINIFSKLPEDYRGHYVADNVSEQEAPVIDDITESYPITDKSREYFVKILDLAGENDIPVLLINTPYIMTADEKKVYNSLEELLTQLGREDVEYLDLNGYVDLIGIDYEKDFADNEHLNGSGTEKLNAYLADYINEHYDLSGTR